MQLYTRIFGVGDRQFDSYEEGDYNNIIMRVVRERKI